MDEKIKNVIENHIENNDVCLFMKGTPDAPQCGFSMADFIKAFLQVVAIVVSAQSSISLHCANNIGSSGKSGLLSFFLSIYSQIVDES